MELKIKCQCGVKYALDVTPESATQPLKFVCQYCGVDSSEGVSQIIRQQFAISVAPPSAVAAVASTSLPAVSAVPPASPTAASGSPAPVAAPSPAVSAAASGSRLKVHSHAQENSHSKSETVEASAGRPCLKHPGHFAQEECLVCHKPICPKCMELFGYLCSAYCEGQAEKLGLEVPVFAGQKAVVESKYWKKVRWISAAAVFVVLAMLAAYTWYYFVGSRPKVLYSIKLPRADSRSFARLIEKDQALLRRGNELSRYDLAADKTVWSVPLIDKDQIAKAAQTALVERKALMAKWKIERARLKAAGQLDDDGPEAREAPRSEAEELKEMSRSVEHTLLSQIHLRVIGSDVWVISPSKAARYSWASGQAIKEVPLTEGFTRVMSGTDDSLLLVSLQPNGRQLLTRLDLVSGEVKTEQAAGSSAEGPMVAKAAPKRASAAAIRVAAKPQQIKAGAMANVASNSIARIAAIRPVAARVPAMDMDSDAFSDSSDEDGPDPSALAGAGPALVFAGENVARLEVKLLEKKLVQYKAVKDKPKVSELDKGVTAANAVAAMSEVLNEIQVDRTGGMRTEDESRYAVTIKRLLGAAPDWSGEVVGPPWLFSVKTVDVLTAGKAIYVFDKSNRKLWESKLAYPVNPGFLHDRSWSDDYDVALSPCVEREQTLYFFDQGVLTAFELGSGNPRWRLTTVGISAIHFDDRGNMFVSTSSAGAESLKYSQQIDLSKRIEAVIMKVDSKSGKILWKVQRTGSDIYLSGKYLYTAESVPAGGMRIYRLNPRNGLPLWDHYEKRYTENREFQQNTMQLLYDDELQVLRFMAL